MLNKITVYRGQEHIAKALIGIPRMVRKRNGNEIVFFDRDYMETFYANLRRLREDQPDLSKPKFFNFGSYK